MRAIPYAVAISTACLIVLTGWALLSLFVTPDETLVIEVVPLPDRSQIRVQVEGAVAQPGVYLLPVGSTREAAIAAAGGATEGVVTEADETGAPLSDGDIVRVTTSGEQAESPAGPIDINSASAAELESLPGIGPVIAGRIVAYREEHGPFAAIDDLAAVSGVSERMVEELRSLAVAGTP